MTAGFDRIRTAFGHTAAAMAALHGRLDGQAAALERACDAIRTRCGDGAPGRLVVSGVGKAGHIGAKLSATFASTGTPSLFMHPAEARHGDLGMVQAEDVCLLLSNSGSSEELVALLPSLRLVGCTVVALVGNPASPLARHADIVLSIGRVEEACPLGLAPSTSTSLMLALGDAVALAVLELRGYTAERYARHHPGGALGRKLMTCREAMRTGPRCATVQRGTAVGDCLRAITGARSGSAIVVEPDGRLAGIFTDGDLRRRLAAAVDPAALLRERVGDHATIPCRHVAADALLQEALHICAERKINELPVVDAAGLVVGLIDVQDLVDRGFEISAR